MGMDVQCVRVRVRVCVCVCGYTGVNKHAALA